VTGAKTGGTRPPQQSRIPAGPPSKRGPDSFHLRFAERKETLKNFYQVLHQAVESGNNDHLQAALYGILEVIKTDPLADYDKFVQAYQDPNIQLEI